jgi:RNA polymerase sigma-70 factor (ECF subfamily)
MVAQRSAPIQLIVLTSRTGEPNARQMRERWVGVVIGDEALRDLHDAHALVVRAYAMRITSGDLGLAEDAVQETFLRAWRHPEVLDSSRGSTRAWLITTVRNVLIDAHRARKSRPDTPTEIVPEVGDNRDDIERMLQRTVLVDALAALASAHRDVIVECYYGGASIGEAAARFGVPPGTIKSRLFYGLRALRAALAERGVEA